MPDNTAVFTPSEDTTPPPEEPAIESSNEAVSDPIAPLATHSDEVAANINGARLTINSHYLLSLLIGDRWYSFSSPLPTRDLSEITMSLSSTSSFVAKLTCEDADCSHSRISLSLGEKTAFLQIIHSKMKPVYGEIQKNCETPVFFEYEMDELLSDSPKVRSDLDHLQNAEWIYATISHVKGWNEELFDSIHVDFFKHDKRILSLNDSVRTETQHFLIEQSRLASTSSFSYGLVGNGPNTMLSFIKAHFPLKDSSTKELCYHLPLIPELLE